MRRLIVLAVLLAATFFSATPAQAFWGRHCGWGRCGGCGWGGYGYRGWGGYYGGYRSYYRGYGYPGYGYGGGGYGGWGYSGYGSPNYSMGYSPTYYSYSMYSPYYVGAANAGASVAGVPASVNNPLYGTTNRAPSAVYVSSPSFTAPVFGARPTSVAAPATGPVVTPAVVTPAAAAVQKFLGIVNLRPVAPLNALPATSAKPVRPIVDGIAARFSNSDSRRKAEKLIAEADELFKSQNFHSALQKYKLAGTTAPDMPEAFWRQGHALVATHNYEQAATTFKRAIALSEDLGRGGFRLSDIYGGANMTKQQHLESLAEWAMNKRNSSDSYFLIGLFLEYDGQTARAEKFFQKASDLAGISGGHMAGFLPPAESSLLKSVERTAAKPAVSAPIVTISTSREI